MAVESLRVRLRGWHGDLPTISQFFESVGLEPESGFEPYPPDCFYLPPIIDLFAVSMGGCRSASEPAKEFLIRVDVRLRRAAEWLDTLSPATFAEWQELGDTPDIFIDGRMNGDQFDLALPPEFLLACGRLDLPITICTND